MCRVSLLTPKLFSLFLAVLAMFLFVRTAQADAWLERKCNLYKDAWTAVSADTGTATQPLEGISQKFQDDHAAFLASDCKTFRNVCPSNDAELALTNRLTLMAVSEGMTGTFLPFNCKKQDGQQQ